MKQTSGGETALQKEQELWEEQLLDILQNKKIKPVYQPIVSLQDGKILGYEALSRVTLENVLFNIEEMFELAEEMDQIWELEELCRKKSIKNASKKEKGKKLFLNVDPNIIYDRKFQQGVTSRFLRKYGLIPEDIIFEVTERNAVEDKEAFQETLRHYKGQHYQIAVDDFGNGYAGLNRVCLLSPDYLKIDMAIVRDIHKDDIKKALVESFVQFSNSTDIKLIAEGIENAEELRTLIGLGVHYGQGYYLQRPGDTLSDISKEVREEIQSMKVKCNQYAYVPSFFGNVGMISKRQDVAKPDTPSSAVFEYVEHNPLVTEICVVDEKKKVLGIITRTGLLEAFGGRYGYNLHARKNISELMDTNFLMVDAMESIENVSKLALLRPVTHLYDAVVVTRQEKYLGVVTVKDLLEAAITIQVSRAADTNPLTGLPGNVVIEKEVKKRIFSKAPFSIAYLDLDHFKAYNDAYGFHNGDMMIKTVVNCMRACCHQNEFMGHVGGDDFVMIADSWELVPVCHAILEKFREAIQPLYSQTDWENGYIWSKDREGTEKAFPIASMSVAIITNKEKKFSNMDSFSKELAALKKKSKQLEGSSCVVI